MKVINPPQRIWVNGKEIFATIFKLQCDFDNLIDKASFIYTLYSDDFTLLVQGYLNMNEPDYTTDWFSNDAAYNWAAKELGLIITGNYQD